jgi:hypothetical protein
MYGDSQTDVESAPFPRRIGAWVGDEGDAQTRASRKPVVRAASLKAAIAQLRDIVNPTPDDPAGKRSWRT